MADLYDNGRDDLKFFILKREQIMQLYQHRIQLFQKQLLGIKNLIKR